MPVFALCLTPLSFRQKPAYFALLASNEGLFIRARKGQMGAILTAWTAFDWMYKNQLGRRNLTEAQRTYLVGKMYEARKKSVGAPAGNNNAEKQCVQNANIDQSGSRTPRTNEILGKELGINPSTITRSEHFAHGIDAIRKADPETADAILAGKLTLCAIANPQAQDVVLRQIAYAIYCN